MAINVKDKLVTLESLGVAYSAEQDAREEADQALSTRIDNIVAPEGDPSLTEVSDARVSGQTTYNTLKARLDADKAAVETEISQLSADLEQSTIRCHTRFTIAPGTEHSSSLDRLIVKTTDMYYVRIRAYSSVESNLISCGSFIKSSINGTAQSYGLTKSGAYYYRDYQKYENGVYDIGIYVVNNSESNAEIDFYIDIKPDINSYNTYGFVSSNKNIKFNGTQNNCSLIELYNSINVKDPFSHKSIAISLSSINSALPDYSNIDENNHLHLSIPFNSYFIYNRITNTVDIVGDTSDISNSIVLLVSHFGGVCGGSLYGKLIEKATENITAYTEDIAEAMSKIKSGSKITFTVNTGAEHSSNLDRLIINSVPECDFLEFILTNVPTSATIYLKEPNGTTHNYTPKDLGNGLRVLGFSKYNYVVESAGVYIMNSTASPAEVTFQVNVASTNVDDQTYAYMGNAGVIEWVAYTNEQSVIRFNRSIIVVNGRNHAAETIALATIEESLPNNSYMEDGYLYVQIPGNSNLVYNIDTKTISIQSRTADLKNKVVLLAAHWNGICSGILYGKYLEGFTTVNTTNINDITSRLYDKNLNLEKIKAYSAFSKNIRKADSFFFFSDPHVLASNSLLPEQYEKALREVFVTLDSYAAVVNPQAIICGGDWLIQGDTQDAACWKTRYYKGLSIKYLSKWNYHNVFGNHDDNYQGKETESSAANTGALIHDAVINMLFYDENTKKSYYTFVTSNTKYYCLDTMNDWDYTMNSYRWEQLQWLATLLGRDDDENNIIVMHIFSNTAENFNETLPMTTNLLNLISAYHNRTSIQLNGESYDFTGKTGKVRCILAGHTHADAIYTSSIGVPVIVITDATNYGNNKVAFDMGFLDYDNNVLYTKRINEGEDRQVALYN